MATAPFFIDFHCHPALKPYGRSFDTNERGTNSPNPLKYHSLWCYDSPTIEDRLIQIAVGIAKFTQSDCSTLLKGNCRLVFASLYPIERGFFRNNLGQRIVSDLVDNFITTVGPSRVNDVQTNTNYFRDLCAENNFYEQLNGTALLIENKTCRYMLINSFKEMTDYLDTHPDAANTVFIATSIEGMHVLHSNIDAPDEQGVLDNLKVIKGQTMTINGQTIKGWKFTPLFVTVAHHFNNHLCGHAQSLFDIVGQHTDQSVGMNGPINSTGKKVIDELLSATNGKRIYVDIKHMSLAARSEYFAMLASDPYKNEKIPVIVSHGAANGRCFDFPAKQFFKEMGDTFMHNDINFYDEEIVKVAKSEGIFALQLDERRLANKEKIKHIKHSIWLNKIRHYRAELVWNQVQYIAELLDHNNLPAWDCMALGTDHDGIINPLNGYLTSENLGDMLQYLERYAFTYMNGRGKQVLKPANQISPSDIVNKIFSENAAEFLSKWFV